jgi:hypothetical protein
MAKSGRPTSYRKEFCKQAEKLCELGATDRELAEFFGVTERTVYRWQIEHEEFCQSLKAGKDSADERVERSLYRRAVGYSFDSVKIMQDKGNELIVPFVEHVPPDVTACIFWLKNRRSKDWRDKREVTGTDGGPIQINIVKYADNAAE